MKILVAGGFIWEFYEKPLFETFQEMGYETYKFAWGKYLEANTKLGKLFKKTEDKFRCGIDIWRMNRDLMADVKKLKPDLIFIYQGVFFTRKTIKTIRDSGAVVFGYCNDDPFSDIAPQYYWKKYLRSCCEYDHIFSYRLKNIDEYKKFYDIDSELLRSYYLKDRNYRIGKVTDKYKHDVVFIGHYENDGRDEMLLEVAKRGYDIQIFGGGVMETLSLIQRISSFIERGNKRTKRRL